MDNFFIALCIELVVVFVIVFWRLRNKYGLFSTEYPIQVIFLGITLGALASTSILLFGAILQFSTHEKPSWTVIASSFAAPLSLIILYWRHIQGYEEKIKDTAELLTSNSLTSRISGYLYLERLSRGNLNFATTAIELLCGHIQTTSWKTPDDPLLKYGIDRLSRIWEYHSGKWNYKQNKEPDMRRTNFAGLELWRVCLKGMFLEQADLSGCYLGCSKFDKAKLWFADFKNSDLTDASFDKAELFGADFTNVKGLRQSQIDKAFGNTMTILPEGLVYPLKWTVWCEENMGNCKHKYKCTKSRECNNSSFILTESESTMTDASSKNEEILK